MLEYVEPNKRIQEKPQIKQDYVWAVQVEYPHIITKHQHSYNTTELEFFECIDDAFKYRHDICLEYKKDHKNRTEFNSYRDGYSLFGNTEEI